MTAILDLPKADLSSTPPRASSRVNRLLHPSSRPTAVYDGDLLAIADWAAGSIEPSRIAGGALPGRQHRRILRTQSVDAWLIALGPSTFFDLHDYGGSRSAFRVVAGTLDEWSTNLDSRALLATVQLRAGDRRIVAARDVHELRNPSELSVLTVHAFSPPLSSLNFYARGRGNYLDELGSARAVELAKR